MATHLVFTKIISLFTRFYIKKTAWKQFVFFFPNWERVTAPARRSFTLSVSTRVRRDRVWGGEGGSGRGARGGEDSCTQTHTDRKHKTEKHKRWQCNTDRQEPTNTSKTQPGETVTQKQHTSRGSCFLHGLQVTPTDRKFWFWPDLIWICTLEFTQSVTSVYRRWTQSQTILSSNHVGSVIYCQMMSFSSW